MTKITSNFKEIGNYIKDNLEEGKTFIKIKEADLHGAAPTGEMKIVYEYKQGNKTLESVKRVVFLELAPYFNGQK